MKNFYLSIQIRGDRQNLSKYPLTIRKNTETVSQINLEELLLRIRILLKRSEKRPVVEMQHNIFQFGANVVNFTTHQAQGTNGLHFQLTKKEVLLLKLLIERKNEVVSRETILETVWGYDVYPSTRTIDNFILTFRKYFELNPKDSRFFHSIRGIGYKFTP